MRIAHVADTTGKAIQEHLIKRILSHSNITVLDTISQSISSHQKK